MYRVLVLVVVQVLGQEYGAPGTGASSSSRATSSQGGSRGSPSSACQGVDLSYDHAGEMLRLVTGKAAELGVAVCVCIRDRHDNLVAHIRMKNALLGSVELSCQKARSSALFPAPSAALSGFPGVELSNGIISNLRGGLPLITSGGVHAGSIGVSGAMTGEEDEEIAKVAVDKLDFILENYW